MNRLSVLKHTLIVSVLVVGGMLVTGGCNKTGTVAADGKSSEAKGGIVFVELDSVIANFVMAQDKSTELEEKSRNSEAELTAKSQSFDRDVRDYQNKAQKGLITRATAAEMEQTLAQQQQNLIALRDQMAYNLNEEGVVAQRQVLEYINQYLAEFNAEHGYQYILARQFPGPILFSDSTLDITAAVIAGLNEKYNSEKSTK